jgi:hypothetical protein
MEWALLGSLLGENSSLSRWVHGWSLVHHLQPRYTSNLQISFFHNRTIYIGNLLATLRGRVETYAKAAQINQKAQRQDACVANPMRRNPSDLDLSRRVGRISVKVGFLFDMVWRSCWLLLLCYLEQLGPYSVDRGRGLAKISADSYLNACSILHGSCSV